MILQAIDESVTPGICPHPSTFRQYGSTFGTELGLSVKTQNRLHTAQNKTIRYVLKLPARLHIDFAHYKAIKWLNVKHFVDYLTLTHVYKCQNGLTPDILQNFTKVSYTHGHFTRLYQVPSVVFRKNAW